MTKRRSSRMADWRYSFDVFWESLARQGDHLDPWLGRLGSLFTIAGVLLICRRWYVPGFIQSHPLMAQRHPLLVQVLAIPISSQTEDKTGLYGGLVLVTIGAFTGLRWFIRRGQA